MLRHARFALKEHAENIVNLFDCLLKLSAFKQVMIRPQFPPVRLTLCLRNRQLLEDPFQGCLEDELPLTGCAASSFCQKITHNGP